MGNFRHLIYNTINTTMNILNTLTSLLAPHVCLGCGTNGAVVCDNCLELYTEPVQPRCVGCKKLSEDFKVCTSCRSWLPLHAVFVFGDYEGVNEHLVRSLKFDCQRDAAKPMSKLMSKPIEGLDEGFVLCPIPTAPARIRARGFDHAQSLAGYCSKYSGIPVHSILKRHTNVRQLGSSRSERIRQMATEFEVSISSNIAGKRILLVDDVLTTGATLSSAARILRDAGAKSVSAIVFAQKR